MGIFYSFKSKKGLSSLSQREKEAMGAIALGILGVKTGGRIRTNDPAVYSFFVDFFGVNSQEEILPHLKNIMAIDQNSATAIVRAFTHRQQDEFRLWMLDRIGDDNRTRIALAFFLQSIGFKL